MAEYSFDSQGINVLIILLTSLSLFFFFSLKKLKSSQTPPLPPGPTSWPIIGTITHLLLHPKTDHISLANLAQSYGPLLHFKLGTQHVVVGSSAAAAAEILRANDRVLSGRGYPRALPKTPAQIDRLSFWADTTSEHWKNLRTVCRAELFTAKALERLARVREEKAEELVAELRSKEGAVVEVERMVFDTVVNIASNTYFSKDVVGFEGILKGIGEVFSTPNISDRYPILEVFDLQGLRKKYMECSMKMWGMWDPILKERRQASELRHQDLMDKLISRGFEDEQINHLLEDLFTGGIHTTTSIINKTLTELLSTPQCITKLRQELDAAFDGQDSITTSMIDNLPYLEACIKETLRLHPPAPLMLNHRAYAACRVMNYTIPRNAQVLVNVWAIGRDPAVWAEPLQYRPERFLGDFKGHDFEFLPFGAGRRICPGISMANKIVALVVASSVYCFDWSAPSQIEGPLLLVPRARK